MQPVSPKEFQISQASAKTGDDKQFKDLINSQLYKTYNLMIIAKKNSQNWERIDYTVQKISNFNSWEASRGILEMMSAYKNKNNLMVD